MESKLTNRLAAAFLGGTISVSQAIVEIWGTADATPPIVTAVAVMVVYFAVQQFLDHRWSADDETQPEAAQ